MRMLKKMLKFSGMLLIGFMFAVSMVLGIVPIVPKRKEQFEIEIKMDKIEKYEENTALYAQPGEDG
jgi:hypothetical protein